jgi:hypothetical protein
MNTDPQITPREFSETIQELRDEMRRDSRKLAQAVELRPHSKPSVSPLTVMMSLLGGGVIGAAGMSMYESSTSVDEPITPPVDVRAELDQAMKPYTQQLGQATESLVASEQSALNDLKAHGLLLNNLSERIDGLRKSADTRNAAFHERVDLLADELAAKLARDTKAVGNPTVAARPIVPDHEESAVQPANAETDVTAEQIANDKPPTTPVAEQPQRGELLIDNPSRFDLKLLINDEPIDIKAHGVTTIDVTIGTIKTQIANLDETVRHWDQWKTVDGTQQLTIHVDSGTDYYKLR